MITVAAFASTAPGSAPGNISGAQNLPTQPFVNTQEAVGGDATARSYSEPACPRAGLTPANITPPRANQTPTEVNADGACAAFVVAGYRR